MGSSIYPTPGTPKPVQRGEATFASGDNTINVTIATVNVSKASYKYCGVSSTGTSLPQVMVRGRVSGVTTLTLTREASGVAAIVSWEVHEVY